MATKNTTPRKKPNKQTGPKSVPRKAVKQPKQKRQHPKFGTSKLEEDFANNFLDLIGVDYIYEYFAKQIGRYYDFAIIDKNEKNLLFEVKNGIKSVKQDDKIVPITMLIEIDGSYYHSDPRLVKEEDMNPMQKRNKRVDEVKNQWALMHGIPLIRIWEKDIRENPQMVMDYLKNRLHIEDTKQSNKNEKNKRHVNKLNKK